MKFRINAAILGSTGYTGIELIRLLSFHKKVEIKYLISKSSYGKKISDFYPGLNFKNYPKLIKFTQVDWKEIDIIFLCLPTGESKKIITKCSFIKYTSFTFCFYNFSRYAMLK